MAGENIKSSRIVVVDDSKVDLMFVESILREAGYTHIDSFIDPAKAMFHILSEVPDLLVIDLYLNGVTAVEIIAKLRQNLKARFLPIVVISSSEDSAMVVQALRKGADDFIAKTRDAVEITIRVSNILNREYYRRSMEYKQKQLEEDIRFAAKLQEKMLTLQFPEIEGFCFDCLYKPYHIASGDFYKAVRISPSRVFIMLADVSGHGVGATLVAFHMDLMLRDLLGDNGVSSLLTAVMHDVPEEERELQFIAQALNGRLYAEYGQMGLFAATFLGIIDNETKSLQFIAAGSPPPLFQAGKQVREVIQKSSRPLGVMPDTVFRRNLIPLTFDRLLIFTDGIFEVAKRTSGEMLDISGLSGTASKLLGEGRFSLENLYTRIAHDYQFNFEDDVTILAIGKAGTKNSCRPELHSEFFEEAALSFEQEFRQLMNRGKPAVAAEETHSEPPVIAEAESAMRQSAESATVQPEATVSEAITPVPNETTTLDLQVEAETKSETPSGDDATGGMGNPADEPQAIEMPVQIAAPDAPEERLSAVIMDSDSEGEVIIFDDLDSDGGLR